MPLKRESFLVPHCPVCDERVNLYDEDGHSVVSTRAEAVEALHETDGDTLDEKIAMCCKNSKCSDEYLHRRCKTRPCEYCRSKVKGGNDGK